MGFLGDQMKYEKVHILVKCEIHFLILACTSTTNLFLNGNSNFFLIIQVDFFYFNSFFYNKLFSSYKIRANQTLNLHIICF